MRGLLLAILFLFNFRAGCVGAFSREQTAVGDRQNQALLLSSDPTPSKLGEELSEFYRQDPQDLNAESFLLSLSPTKRQALQELLEQVYFARRKKEYDKSDELSSKIRQLGVRIYNDPPVWTTGAAPASYVRRKQSQSTKLNRDLFGSKGHPFRQVGTEIRSSTCPLSFQEINTLLSKHTKAHMEGRYEEADAIAFEVKINGVHCDTKNYLWRADGKKTWDDVNLLREEDSAVDDYKEESTGDLMESPKEGQVRMRVEQLVNQRSDVLFQDDAYLAQCLSLELWKTYGVVVNDSERTWSFQNRDSDQFTLPSLPMPDSSKAEENLVPTILFAPNKAPRACSYRLSIHSLPLQDDEILKRVESLIEERAQKREEGKFREADAMRSEIWMTYYVGLNDKLRQWSVGGVFDNEGSEPQ